MDFTAPSTLIRNALHCLRRINDDDRYVIDLTEWHYRHPIGITRVGLAGAVMAKSYGASTYETLHPNDLLHAKLIDEPQSQQLVAIMCFSNGQIATAFKMLGRDKPEEVPCEMIIRKTDVKLFEQDMRALATLLTRHKS